MNGHGDAQEAAAQMSATVMPLNKAADADNAFVECAWMPWGGLRPLRVLSLGASEIDSVLKGPLRGSVPYSVQTAATPYVRRAKNVL